jgi:hypothetical protein
VDGEGSASEGCVPALGELEVPPMDGSVPNTRFGLNGVVSEPSNLSGAEVPLPNTMTYLLPLLDNLLSTLSTCEVAAGDILILVEV